MRKAKEYDLGRVVSVSPQGSRLFVVARSIGESVLDIEMNLVQINTGIIGNVYNMPESELRYAEILIPLSIDTEVQSMNPEKLIDKIVRVELDSSGSPIIAHLMDTSDSARIISAQAIKEARFVSKSLKLSSQDSVNFLKNIGFTEKEIKDIDSEAVAFSTIQGKVIKYGDAATSYKVSKYEGAREVDLISSLRSNIVTGVSSEQLKNKSCHIQIKAFSAK